jgi:hypothetical protein
MHQKEGKRAFSKESTAHRDIRGIKSDEALIVSTWGLGNSGSIKHPAQQISGQPYFSSTGYLALNQRRQPPLRALTSVNPSPAIFCATRALVYSLGQAQYVT